MYVLLLPREPLPAESLRLLLEQGSELRFLFQAAEIDSKNQKNKKCGETTEGVSKGVQ